MEKDNNKPEAYPRPSTADKQLEQQNEFIDQQPNNFGDKAVSDIAAPPATHQTNNPDKGTKEEDT